MITSVKTVAAACALAVLAAGTAAPAALADRASWTKAVVKKVAKSHIYPRSAIRREIEGVAKVKVQFDRSGNITGFEIVEPTGNAVLDNTIPKMITKMDPLPTPPAEFAEADLEVTIPFAWRLQ